MAMTWTMTRAERWADRQYTKMYKLKAGYTRKKKVKKTKKKWWMGKGERLSKEYREWRFAVLARDNNACVKCNDTNELHAHHIKPFSKHKNLRYNVDNGETLCRRCHEILHLEEIIYEKIEPVMIKEPLPSGCTKKGRMLFYLDKYCRAKGRTSKLDGKICAVLNRGPC